MKIQKLSPLLNKYYQIIKRINPKSWKFMVQKIDIANPFIWAFILIINLGFETRGEISCKVLPLKSMRDYKLDHPISQESFTYLLLYGVIFYVWALNLFSAFLQRGSGNCITCGPHVLEFFAKIILEEVSYLWKNENISLEWNADK